MTDSLPEPPDLEPASLAASEFTRARRGLEATEVRAALGRAADALRAWQERDARLVQRLEELEQRLDESHELDEQRIATVLGEETARIVTAAREAAAEIRSNAESHAEELRRTTEEQANAAADALRSEAQTLRDEAARLHTDAVAETTRLREEAESEVARLRDEAQSETATIREEAAALATSTVSDAQARSDELLAAAESVLAERTAEAEAAAEVLTAAAAAELAAAEERAEELRTQSDAEVAATLDAAGRAADELRSDAAAAAEQVLEQARETGRGMVAEAREVRERMLRDLAERRRTARRQIEGAIAGRDRIVEVLRAAGEEVGHTIAELDRVDDAAAEAAEHAASAVDEELDEEVEALRSEVVGADDLGDEPEAAAAVMAAVAELDGEVAQIVEVIEVDTTQVEVVDAVAVSTPRDTAGGQRQDELLDEDLHDDGQGEDDDTDEGGATVHDLFARIRAEGLDEAEESDAGGGDDDAAATEAVAAAIEEGDLVEVEVAGAAEAIDLTDDAATGGPATDDVAAEAADDTGVPESLLDRRDAVLVPIEKGLSRVLKRVASDEQNEILDRLRRVKRGRPDPAEILPAEDDRFVDALDGEFANAVQAGATFWAELTDGDVVTVDGSDESVRAALVVRVSEFLALHRAHLERSFAEADEEGLDTTELADRVRASYRDWRSGSLADLAGDLATAGFTMGERLGAGPGTPWRWVVDHGGLPCADGEDNALAGAVPCEEPFPTGDVTPPAHPGCRCILAPARR